MKGSASGLESGPPLSPPISTQSQWQMIWSSPLSVFVRFTESAFTQVTSGAVVLHDDSHFGAGAELSQARTKRTSISLRSLQSNTGAGVRQPDTLGHRRRSDACARLDSRLLEQWRRFGRWRVGCGHRYGHG